MVRDAVCMNIIYTTLAGFHVNISNRSSDRNQESAKLGAKPLDLIVCMCVECVCVGVRE